MLRGVDFEWAYASLTFGLGRPFQWMGVVKLGPREIYRPPVGEYFAIDQTETLTQYLNC